MNPARPLNPQALDTWRVQFGQFFYLEGFSSCLFEISLGTFCRFFLAQVQLTLEIECPHKKDLGAKNVPSYKPPMIKKTCIFRVVKITSYNFYFHLFSIRILGDDLKIDSSFFNWLKTTTSSIFCFLWTLHVLKQPGRNKMGSNQLAPGGNATAATETVPRIGIGL